MDPWLAYCGLPCDSCPIHLATLEPDDRKRQELRTAIARLCTEQYGVPLDPLAVTDCDGCRAGGRLFSGCRDCRIRPCAVARGLDSCAFCADYPCAVLEEHCRREPLARDRLDRVRAEAL